MGYVTDGVRALLHRRTPRQTAAEAIGADSLRRFVQATMEPDPVHWDEQVAAASRYGQVVAPPLYPVHAFRRPAGAPRSPSPCSSRACSSCADISSS